MIYVLLLRGVNVGGNKKVPQSEFKSVLESLGCQDVKIYINSGNAIFNIDFISVDTIKNALESYFGFEIPTLLIPKDKFIYIANHIPDSWTNDAPNTKDGRKSDVLFLFDDISKKDILNDLNYNQAIEEMIYVDGAVITSVLRVNQHKGNLQKLPGTKLYNSMTIRNVNTVRKLKDLILK